MLTPAAKAAMRAAALKDAEERFASGEGLALLQAVLLAAAGRQPVAEWARRPLREIERRLSAGKLKDLNEAFGWRDGMGDEAHQSRRKADSDYRRRAPELLQELIRSRVGGKGMSAVTFEEIAEQCGVGRSLVQRTYTANKPQILSIEVGAPSGTGAVLIMDWWDE